jgi:translation initiation factor 1A
MAGFNRNESGPSHKLMIPRGDEVVGVVVKAQGASKFLVMCADKKERDCSIPGRLRRSFWVKERDMVLVKPWPYKNAQGHDAGDIVWRYSLMDKDLLKARGVAIPK